MLILGVLLKNGGVFDEAIINFSNRIRELHPSSVPIESLGDISEEAFGKAVGTSGNVKGTIDINRILKEAEDFADIRRLTGDPRESAISNTAAQRLIEAITHESSHIEPGHGPNFFGRMEDIRKSLGPEYTNTQRDFAKLITEKRRGF